MLRDAHVSTSFGEGILQRRPEKTVATRQEDKLLHKKGKASYLVSSVVALGVHVLKVNTGVCEAGAAGVAQKLL